MEKIEGALRLQDLTHAVENRLGGVRRGRWHFQRGDPAPVQKDQVGEGPTGIDGQQGR